MRVLMFGWEFPPYKSGGLGTACYGMGLSLIHIFLCGAQLLRVPFGICGNHDRSSFA